MHITKGNIIFFLWMSLILAVGINGRAAVLFVVASFSSLGVSVLSSAAGNALVARYGWGAQRTAWVFRTIDYLSGAVIALIFFFALISH